MPKPTSPKPSSEFSIVVLLSGKGSNFQAILKHIEKRKLNIRISAVISNKAEAQGLKAAQNNGIEPIFLDPSQYTDRTNFDTALLAKIEYYQPDLIVLAGYMRILSSHFVEHFEHKLINIHPSLLPKYKGLKTHQRALNAGDSHGGCSVHIVTSELDDGPILGQKAVAILPNDTSKDLSARVLIEEHHLYQKVLAKFVKDCD